MKKKISIFFRVFAIFLLSLGVSADEKNKYQKETDFLNSIYMPMEYVQNIYSVDNSVVFEMNYLENGEISHITYTENNGDITVFIDENTVYDELVFKKNGDVYLDGIITHIYDKKAVAPLRYASTDFVSSMPTSYKYTSFVDYGTASYPDIVLSKALKDTSEGLVLSCICNTLSIPTSKGGVISSLARILIDTAKDLGTSSNVIHFKATIKYCTSIPAGLQNVYKYNASGIIDGYNSHVKSTTYYKVETLV